MKKSRAEILAYQKKWHTSEMNRKYNIRRYGIHLEDYEKLLKEQNYRCAICGTDNPGSKNFSVDHDHQTKKVRGLLCRTCNLGLGEFKDSVDCLRAAIEYILRNR